MPAPAAVLVAVLAALACLVAVMLVRAARLRPARPAGAPLDAGGWKADDQVVERFRELLRIATVSRDDPALVDRSQFELWLPTLERLYPATFEAAELHRVDDYGILLRIPGEDPSLDPVVMLAHQDVVPVEGQDWEHDPFGAEVVDGEIWARGTLDTKCIAAAFFEAAERMASEGRRPARDVWYFSSDGEEVHAPTARHAVEWLRDHDVRPCLVLDEGGAVATEVGLGVEEPVAMLGVCEKGFVDLVVTASSEGGHASTPTSRDATRLLARACERVAANPGEARFTPALVTMLSELASRSSLPYRVVFANLWLTRPLVARIMEGSGEMAAMLRSTYALTQLEGSPQRNVLPPAARANFNVRVAPFETNADALARARAQVAAECRASGVDEALVTVEPADEERNEPSPTSPFVRDAAYDYIHRCVAGVYPEAGCAPYQMNACSDSRQFNEICERVYRFCGFVYSREARGLVHAPNERIGVDVYKRGVEFYVAFMENLDRLGELGA